MNQWIAIFYWLICLDLIKNEHTILHHWIIYSIWRTRWIPKSRLQYSRWQSWMLLVQTESVIIIQRSIDTLTRPISTPGYLIPAPTPHNQLPNRKSIRQISVNHYESRRGIARLITKCAWRSSDWEPQISVAKATYYSVFQSNTYVSNVPFLSIILQHLSKVSLQKRTYYKFILKIKLQQF